jgi:uncharacterized SAM-binding protein YcdF (DUF218 family)
MSASMRARIPKRGYVARKPRRQIGCLSLLLAAAAVFALSLLAGFFLFLIQIYSADNAHPAKVDVIVAFSGDPLRIRVATNLLKEGYSKRLIIVGQDNRDEVSRLRSANKALFNCCVRVDHESRNTAEDALLAHLLTLGDNVGSIMLLTSSFHMPRAQLELSRFFVDADLKPFGLSDDTYNVRRIFLDPVIARRFLTQYFMFVLASVPGSKSLVATKDAREFLDFFLSWRNIALLLATAASAVFALFAISKHRRRT